MMDSDHHRTEEVAHLFEILLGPGPGRDILIGAARRTELEALRRIPRFAVFGDDAAAFEQIVPLVLGQFVLFHGTPRGAVAVDDALTRDSDILRTDGRQRRLAAPRVQSLERDLRQRIERFVVAEKDQRALFKVQFDAVFQHDRPRVPYAGRNDDPAAALFGECVDRIGECLGAKRMAVGHRAVIGDADAAIGNGRTRHGGHVEWQIFRRCDVGDIGCLAAAGRQRKGGAGGQPNGNKF